LSSSRESGKLVVLNSDNGKIIADIPPWPWLTMLPSTRSTTRLRGGDQLLMFPAKDPITIHCLQIPEASTKTGILVPELNRIISPSRITGQRGRSSRL